MNESIYTAPDSALEQLMQRRQDPLLRERTLEYLGGILPCTAIDQDMPVAILARYVPRATGEDRMFNELAHEAGFAPYWASYLDDRFTVRNPEKVATIRPPINWRKGQRTRSWIVAPDKRTGGVGQLETIYAAETAPGEITTSAQFQRGIREIIFEREAAAGLTDQTFDLGDWYGRQAKRFGYQEGNLAPYYYPALMGLAATFCVLYEDFNGGPNAGNGDLARFTEGVVKPAINKVKRDLGVRPLIVQLPYRNGMGETDLSFLDAGQEQVFKQYGRLMIQRSGTVEEV